MDWEMIMACLGKYVAFHNYRARISAKYEGMQDYKTEGGRPSCAYIPRFRNVRKQETDFLRGYATTFNADRYPGTEQDGFGEELKDKLMDTQTALGPWSVGSP